MEIFVGRGFCPIQNLLVNLFCFSKGLNAVEELIDDYVAINEAGLVLELCGKYYEENVVMLNNGTIFAESMRDSYNKKRDSSSPLADLMCCWFLETL